MYWKILIISLAFAGSALAQAPQNPSARRPFTFEEMMKLKRLSDPVPSPDGKWIAFTISDDPPRWAGYRRLALIPAAGGTPKLLAETFDAQPGVID